MSENPKQNPPPIHIRPPSFQRRFMASATDDSNTLVALASDESYFVRRKAVQNPSTPPWILVLLVRAGATPDLRGKGEKDLNLDADSLRRLVETGPWAQQLVAEHPNTSAEVLAVLKDQPSMPLRLAVATHPHADEATLAVLCCDSEGRIRAQAVAHPNCSPELIDLLVAAGAEPDLQGVSRQVGDLSADQLIGLADLGAWGRFLVARHPGSAHIITNHGKPTSEVSKASEVSPPETLLAVIAHDPDWRVRSGLLDNSNTPEALLLTLLEPISAEALAAVKQLSHPQILDDALAYLAASSSLEVRFALARHPAATPDVLAQLLSDGAKEIRQLATSHPHTRAEDVDRLVRAGSTPDLLGLSEPDPTMTEAEIATLVEGGIWARQLAVRHPNASAETVARLLCNEEPKIREWAAVHPNLSSETKENLLRAGSGTDFQGVMPADQTLPAEALWEIAELGRLARWSWRTIRMPLRIYWMRWRAMTIGRYGHLWLEIR